MRRRDAHTSPTATRVLHVINTLDVGGAERSLHKLVATLDRSRFDSAIVSLAGRGVMADEIASFDIPIYSLGLREGGARVGTFRHVLRAVKSWHPDLVQGWMYYGNLAAVALVRLMGQRLPVVWNVRHSVDRLDDERRRTRWSIQAGALISRQAETIIYNSPVSARQHERLGYRSHRAVVIPNGFDTSRFAPSEARRGQLRSQLRLSEETLVVGMVARYHPMKDHDTLLAAARRVQSTRSNVVFLLAGRGVTSENIALTRRIEKNPHARSIRLLGEVDDPASLMATLDVLVSASAYGEGFPNVVGEAMAVGVPCVVTDIGDSAMLVGTHGLVVGPRDTTALATAIAGLLDMRADKRRQLGLQARERIVQSFSLENMTSQYAALYDAVFA